ncbi:hypothetical protein FQZ97_1057580 [compost metagenome]
MRVQAQAGEGELGQVGLAEGDHSQLRESGNHGGIVQGYRRFGADDRAGRGPAACDIDQVLHRIGNAVEPAQRRALAIARR